MAPPWPLTSSHLNTAPVYYLLDLSSCSLLSTLFWYFLLRILFVSFSFVVHKGSSSRSNTTTNRKTATRCFSSANTTKADTSSESHSIYVRTATTAEQPSIGPAQRSKVHSVVRSCRKSESSVAESRVPVFYVSFFAHFLMFRLCFYFIKNWKTSAVSFYFLYVTPTASNSNYN